VNIPEDCLFALVSTAEQKRPPTGGLGFPGGRLSGCRG
jgi:hypothetical protein